ncbi:MAG TPA: Lrp/AsnC family transcriptional regulator [Spirochaetes bacterium]|nr:Lrp/AsnC family transcriptional regulator [Spirochaetota bacterium]
MFNAEKQNDLAKAIQSNFPIDPRPYAVLAKQIGSDEEEIIAQIKEWKDQCLLREVSAVMEGSVLGYDSALVCARIPKESLDRVTDIISEHPTVTHMYERRHHFNLWFTIATPGDMILEKHIELLQNLTGAERFYLLRRTLTFKIGITFDLISKKNSTKKVKLNHSIPPIKINQENMRIIRVIQKDLPIMSRPFKTLAEENDLYERDVIQFLKENVGKTVRRYVATFRHRNLGVKANGMVVWNISKDELEEKGQYLAHFPEVSHCYARTSFPDFPYSLYSMVHASTREELGDITRTIASGLDCDNYLIMESTKEFKKCRLRYFLPELEIWWENHVKLIA